MSEVFTSILHSNSRGSDSCSLHVHQHTHGHTPIHVIKNKTNVWAKSIYPECICDPKLLPHCSLPLLLYIASFAFCISSISVSPNTIASSFPTNMDESWWEKKNTLIYIQDGFVEKLALSSLAYLKWISLFYLVLLFNLKVNIFHSVHTYRVSSNGGTLHPSVLCSLCFCFLLVFGLG